jgi:poly(A) polymerase
MSLPIDSKEKFIFEALRDVSTQLNMKTYVIGGYVRDKILGRNKKSKDMDIVTIGSGIQFAEALSQYLQTNNHVVSYARFGTAMLQYNEWTLEFVGARKESYQSDSRKPTVENGSLEDDQNRRDFTINALAISMNLEDFGQILDPFQGIQHIQEKKLKTPLNPEITFSDDPLRMLRAIRFATQLQFQIDPETFDGIKSQKDRIKIISQERINAELNKILLSEKPSVGFSLLFKTGLLEIILPELNAMAGIEEMNGIAHKDNFWHTLQVLDNMSQKSNDLWLRWSALLHDIAKPLTKRFYPGQGWTFHGHEFLGTKVTAKIFQRLKLPLDHKLKFVQKMVGLHQRPILLTKDRTEITDSAIRRLLFDAGEDLESLLLLCEADTTTTNPIKKRLYADNLQFLRQRLEEVEKKDHLRLWQPPLTGEDIMEIFKIKPSKEVGILKNAIKDAILDGIIENNYEDAYQFLLAEAAKIGLKI